MAGACMVRAPPLEVPEFKRFRREGLKSVNAACDMLLLRRQEGRLGDPETAKTALEYVVAVSMNGQAAAEQGEAWKHDKSLRMATPELPMRMLAAIALSITPDNVRRLTKTHVEFAARKHHGPSGRVGSGLVIDEGADGEPSDHRCLDELWRLFSLEQRLVAPPFRILPVPPSAGAVKEHGLQIVTLAAQSSVDLRAQGDAAKQALRCFKAEPRLVPRALLALSGLATGSWWVGGWWLWFGGTLYMTASKNATAPSLLEREPKPSDQIEGEDDMLPVGFRDITTAMDVYAKDRLLAEPRRLLVGKIQGAGCRALESALAVPGVDLAQLARGGLLRSLTLAHQRCPQSRSVALSLCRVMGKACARGDLR
eukprot:Skav213814  [mRNA]  locus=scaffold1987:470465:474669:- [translate_table: standard]